ncbi:MAG: Iron-containing alcohol dehydrogenase [Candidatus Gottesmanbacteria bacterium GW2011_GWB1_43_11]|uniref:Iron-containing alcohol dehydrogenase n=1 Tax=Candidatus Gottesmanbacteria bacterium GW2011_GWB1_43_11 TaxID=1618446 RepID=A0A0G1EUU3_9BACT|nr:MAG: Iron-containing alcohol dehydrogenase [Candidatus Gottesmanbacteria bacterium GW2011_GWA2_42_16]KKS55417.1 MAG: Iron-containing alcohol dehydrogenase [Candidatus Gottesmanbacteria bacterium GW2011_GWA1_42_26]KKS81881.1 MAG: Iron-containing alcohol dehydrogenase [Candidatus Gottesmanbacteria bacterium GW2011_GWC1_43_10]KKS86801.1 MAG: Iron-containing alcohol dehydrogenase [Candidatus Gottesmanbacteria bacterium GW2011_GWB1_43_11]OGG10595.1 MAG: hypothetical protein A2699_01750 [Candidatu
MKAKTFEPKKTKRYSMPTKAYFGRNSLQLLGNIIVEKSIHSALLVCGEHFKKSDDYRQVISNLKETPIDVYNEKIKRSDFSTINRIVTYCRKYRYEAIIAIGGGSVLDTAKCAAILTTHKGLIEEYLVSKSKKITAKGLLYIAIPTTAGTGTEVTPWATVWGDNKRKYSLYSKGFMFPAIAIVDSHLTDSLNQKDTATSGMDALCQAIEAYWNKHHNRQSDIYALEAISVIRTNLENAVRNPTKKIRDRMAWGSFMQGLAFSNTQTTICHAVSYPLTARWGVTHGQATSVTLPSFMRGIIPALPKNRQKHLLSALNAHTPALGANVVEQLMIRIGLKIKLSALGITKENINVIIEDSFYTNRVNNIPLQYDKQRLKRFLVAIY